MGVVEVVLKPHVVVSGAAQPDDAAIDALHHAAHERCYIANSLRGEVRVQGRWSAA
jgi:organic hydroperoxide reductase OsmC/OhrA